jgi:hypothetical protein
VPKLVATIHFIGYIYGAPATAAGAWRPARSKAHKQEASRITRRTATARRATHARTRSTAVGGEAILEFSLFVPNRTRTHEQAQGSDRMNTRRTEQRGGGGSSSSSASRVRSAPLATVGGRVEPKAKPNAAARKATSTLQQYGVQLARDMQREGAIRGSPTFQRCIPLPGDIRIPTPRDGVKATTAAPRTPKSRRRVKTTSRVSGSRCRGNGILDTTTEPSTSALSFRRENLCEQACAPKLSQDSPEHFGAQYDENHQLSICSRPLSQEVRGETACEDPECCQWWSQRCHFCAASSASEGAAATPMATSPPDRAPDSPRQAAQPTRDDAVSAEQQKATRKAARNLALAAAKRDRELAVAVMSLDAGARKAMMEQA